MAQASDYTIDNSTGANVRADINTVLQAIATNNSGSSAASTTFASGFFANTSTSMMQLRNTANNDFLNLFTLAGAPAFPVDGTINSVNIGKGTNSVSGNSVLVENALDAAVSGSNNTAVGKSALGSNTSGEGNTALGAFTLSANTSGSQNIAIGRTALNDNTTADNNIAIGWKCAEKNTEGDNNVIIGYQAGQANTTGNNNVGIGFEALHTNTVGDRNVAIGYQALEKYNPASNEDSYNVGIGYHALEETTTGKHNTALGGLALDSNTTSDNSTAVGYGALGLSTGAQNTALGSLAGDVTTTGSNNTSLGYQADPSANDASNEITLGNSSITAIRCQVQTISALSDERDKTDIVDSEDGLDLINSLRPRKFTWAMREPSNNDGKTELGFIAQEIDAALGNKNDYIGAVYKSNPEKLEASYGKFIPILVKAVQELSAKVTALEAG